MTSFLRGFMVELKKKTIYIFRAKKNINVILCALVVYIMKEYISILFVRYNRVSFEKCMCVCVCICMSWCTWM